jgi:hypothetical protein
MLRVASVILGAGGRGCFSRAALGPSSRVPPMRREREACLGNDRRVQIRGGVREWGKAKPDEGGAMADGDKLCRRLDTCVRPDVLTLATPFMLSMDFVEPCLLRFWRLIRLRSREVQSMA